MRGNDLISGDFSIAYYAGDRNTGAVAVIRGSGDQTSVAHLETAPESGMEKPLKPILVGVSRDGQIILLDPKTKKIRVETSFPTDAFPAHIYSDPTFHRDWFMNDGDKETGNDTLNCGDQGSSVTVIEESATPDAKFLKTICVGRGHHQAAFTFPSESAPNVPHRAYISNLKDGTLSVIGNDADDADTYLKLIATINLCDPAKEEGGADAVPNNSFPHGLAYASATGKLYNLNNGYGTVSVIDPVTNRIEETIPFKGHSNLLVAPDGRHILGRGADRKSDANHVIAKLAVLDTVTKEIVASVDLPDVYISKYFINPEGTKLYLTTSSSGSPEQQANLKTDAVLVYDMKSLPQLKLIKELRLGAPTGTLAFVQQSGATTTVFASTAETGSVAVIDGQDDEVRQRIDVGAIQSHSRIWLIAD